MTLEELTKQNEDLTKQVAELQQSKEMYEGLWRSAQKELQQEKRKIEAIASVIEVITLK